MEEKCLEKSDVIEPTLNPKLAVAVDVATATDCTIGIAKSTNHHQAQHSHHLYSNNLLPKPEPKRTSSAERSALHDILLILPSTSCSSMSLLQEEDFGNSQHDFAEVLDEDTTTSGVLETFEISSSNSLPTCSDTAADVAVVDDSSSADAVKMLKVSTVAPALVSSTRNHNNNHSNNRASNNNSSSNNKFFNESEIYVINDDDDEDDEEDDDDDEVDDDDDDDDEVDADDDVDDEEVNADLDDEEDDDDDVAVVVTDGELVGKTPAIPTQLNDVITGTGGQTIYLETPVVEERQHLHHHHHHHHHHQSNLMNIVSTASVSGANEPGLPKRLSDEFMLHADDMEDHNSAVLIEIDNSNDNEQGSENEQEEDNNDEDGNEVDEEVEQGTATTEENRASLTDKTTRNTNVDIAAPVSDAGVGGPTKMAASSDVVTISGTGRVKSEPGSNVEGNAERMSFRLKNMSINNSTSQESVGGSGNSNATTAHNELPSGSNGLITAPTMADIESMDLIERRDFETEQRLTGGIILKSSSLTNKNLLNLRLVKQAAAAQAQQSQSQQNILQSSQQQSQPENSNSLNTMGRAFSSDSKCTYKEPLTTPTSSRTYNSRLTKSTAKLNMNSTLSQHSVQQQQQQQQQPSVSASDTSTTSSSVIVEPTSAMASTSNSNSLLSNVSNSASSERAFLSVNNICQHQRQHHQQDEQIQQQDQLDSGCSRTSALFSTGGNSNNANGRANDDTEPSTSARCQYTPQTKAAAAAAAATSSNIRLMHHASAQTNDRYVSRGAPVRANSPNVVLGGGSSGLAYHLNLAAPGSLRSRRRAEAAANAARNSNTDGLIATFKGFAEAAASSDSVEIIDDDAWVDCEENTTFDLEEVCTCPHRSDSESSHSSNSTLNEDDFETTANSSALYRDGLDLPGYLQTADDATYADGINETGLPAVLPFVTSTGLQLQQRKRKYDGRILDHEGSYCGVGVLGMGKGINGTSGNEGLACGGASSGAGGGDANSRKRMAYDFSSTSTPRSSYGNNNSLVHTTTPTTTTSQLAVSPYGSPLGRRTPRSIIPTRENPPPELQSWLAQYQRWTHAERLIAVDRLIDHCEPTQVRHMMKVIEPQFQRDFISLLPRELALQVLAYLDPKDLLRAAQTCRSWRFLCDDNLLWREKCRKAQILTEPLSDRPKRGRAGKMPPIASEWKAAYMRQHIIEMNWRSRPIRDPKVLKGHDEHVITCLQFSGNRIVSGSDDNTLKVWSAVTGKCLRTLVGHTGGVWSSQMSGNIIISGSTDRTLKVWDMETGMCIHTLLGHTSTVRCMHLHGNKVVSGSRDATLRVWDIEQGQCLHVLVGHVAAVRCVQYDGKLIVSGAYDYIVKIWHPERQECLHTLQGHTNRVYSLQFDGVHVVSGSLDTSIRVWDVETGNCKHTLMGHQSLTSGMELRQNILVSGNADSTVKVWDITTGQCLQTLSGPNKHQSAVTCLQFNSRFVVTSSDDGTVKLWDVKTGEFIRNLVSLESGGSGGVVWRIRANDTKLICAVGSRNGTEETKLLVLDFDVEGACVKCS